MTDYNSTKKSLVELLELEEDKIFDFILEDTNVVSFLDTFNIKDEKLLDKYVELVSLHSTTCIDNCQSIEELGLINLQDAVTKDTPLKNYLNNKDIKVNIKDKKIIYKENHLDISTQIEGYCLSKEDDYKNRVIHKFYDDFQINGFISHTNVLKYEGYTRDRPEILFNLAQFLKDEKIEQDWIKDKNIKHYIIKYKLPLNYYRYFTFEAKYDDSDYGITKYNLEYLPKKEIEVRVKKWVIQKAIYILRYGVYELYSYVHPKVKIETKDIMEIMTELEYITKYNIKSKDKTL